MKKLIASCCLEADNSYSHYAAIYEDGTILRSYEETYYDDWEEEPDPANCEPQTHYHEEIDNYPELRGDYCYEDKVKAAVNQAYSDGKINKLPEWL
ncbi:hypothetical protein NIES267_75110 (plasmid) [Calothrix parasitica NIES-267]|uniref:Uncharacterized protein n=1 Tax=Calothrix parasitica NIES-267 TaxID=1973488 RepID=A0A1Z4M3B2_9CYAN|nr:hypothetical protein NIES267_75110 [Calothrix parasitica NIES-267]